MLFDRLRNAVEELFNLWAFAFPVWVVMVLRKKVSPTQVVR